MVLHNLCDTLNRLGYEAAIVFYGGTPPNYFWAYSNLPSLYHPDHQRVELSMEDTNKSVRDFLKHGVIIYPEQITGNPLGAERAVKYLLYKDENYVRLSSNEYILSFSEIFHSSPDGYLFKSAVDENLHDIGSRHWTQRTMDLTYFGKGPKFTECFRIPDTLNLSRTWPQDKNQLGILLRHCRYFFTWDAVSQTNIDAIACGAVPVVLQQLQIKQDDFNYGELGPLPNAHLVDLQNRNSVVGDVDEIDRSMQETNRLVKYYHETWPERVRKFAENVHEFFKVY